MGSLEALREGVLRPERQEYPRPGCSHTCTHKFFKKIFDIICSMPRKRQKHVAPRVNVG
jgi:hypothetical protein